MRIFSMRSSTLKFSLLLILSVVALSSLIILVPSANDAAAATNVSYSGVYSNEDRISFISKFGWTVERDPVEEVEITIPAAFDASFSEYNEIQRAQGLDLEKYRGDTATKFTYGVTNYSGYDGAVYIHLIVFDNKIIGGDVSSADANGFIYGFSGSAA